jgi:aspartate-semialdehyde dehydrogenase
MSQKGYNVAVAGATGAVGNTMIRILEERKFPIKNIRYLASERSVGKTLKFMSTDVKVEQLGNGAFKGVDIALFSAGASRSKEFAPAAVKAGAVVIDNSSAFRMEPEVPLVVPEINPHDLKKHKGIIANPNCTTIVTVMALAPLHKYSRIKRFICSSYQAVSGAGQSAILELERQVKAYAKGEPIEVSVFPYQIAFNILPHIDAFLENGYTKEEMKMVHESRKILGDNEMRIAATTIRVPVFYAHSVSVTAETEKKITPAKARELFAAFPGVKVFDDPNKKQYPMPLYVAGKDDCYVGRIREDLSSDNGLNFWVVGDQLRKGAALNAIQIGEEMIKQGLV